MEQMPGAFPPPPSPEGWEYRPPGFYPLRIGRILQLAWSLYRYAWRTFLGIGFVLLGVPYSLMAVAAALYSPDVNEWLARAQAASRSGQVVPEVPAGFWSAVAVLAVMTIAIFVVTLLATGAMTVSVDATFRGGKMDVVTALRAGAARFPSLLGAQLLYLLVAFGVMFVGFIFGGILFAGGGLFVFLGLVVIVGAFAALFFLGIRFSLLVPTIVLESAGSVEGLGRSWRLVAGSGWRVLGYMLLVAILSGLIGGLLQTLLVIALRLNSLTSVDIAVSTVLDAAISLVLLPIGALVYTLLYYDLRWRHSEPAPTPGETIATR